MSEEDPNYDRDQVLSAIDQAIPTEPAPESYAAPEALPDPLPPAEPEPLPAAELMPQSEELPPAELVPTPEAMPAPEAEAVVPRPLSSRAMPAPLSPWMRHRHEVAGLVTAFVAIVWLAVGVGMGAWGPALLGVLFAGGAACIKAYAPPI